MARLTVLTGPERRRRWAPSEKARIVAESLVPGAIVAEVARRHDVHPNLLHLWRRQARRATGGCGQVNFLPVTLEPQDRSSAVPGGAIEIELAGGVRVRVDGSVDDAALRRVLRALGR
jgi:transposase